MVAANPIKGQVPKNKEQGRVPRPKGSEGRQLGEKLREHGVFSTVNRFDVNKHDRNFLLGVSINGPDGTSAEDLYSVVHEGDERMSVMVYTTIGQVWCPTTQSKRSHNTHTSTE
jgi:hypothetical protein